MTTTEADPGQWPEILRLHDVWLVRDGEVLATAQEARTRRERAKGLLGRDGFTGALVFRPCRQVHTIGMRFAIDVAFCASDGTVIRTSTLRPRRFSALVWRSAFVIEAEAGAFERWGLRVDDCVEIKE